MTVQATRMSRGKARFLNYENVKSIQPCVYTDIDGHKTDAYRLYFSDGTAIIIPDPWKLWITA